MGKHRVVILGGGFAGLYAAKALRNAPVDVTLIDKRNFHLFQPLLYQVATGGLSPGDIAAPLRAALRGQSNTEVKLAEVTAIDAKGRRVHAQGPVGPLTIEYDSLIVAGGSTHSYFGHPEWEPIAPGLKTVEDATEMRQRLLSAFEAAEIEPSPELRREWLTFLVVGAGPTGVELAGAIGEIAGKTLREDFRHINPEEANILLLDASERVLQAYPVDLSHKAERALIHLGVRTRSRVRVTKIDERGATLDCGGTSERIAARTVFWAAGVQASPLGSMLAETTGVPLDRAGRVMVAPDLSVPGYPEILVCGDMVHLENDGKPVPGVAPAAMQMGKHAARQIIDQQQGKQSGKPFHYFDKGSLAVIGRASAVADFGSIRLSGYIAWLAWLFIHLMYIVGFQNRVLVFIQWGFQYFTFNRGARLITKAR
jgi:NADH dehydrogenase